MNGKIFNISAGKSFVDELAAKFSSEYKNRPEELAKVLFLLPTRRACQNLTEAFVRRNGLQPTILPQILPVVDTDEDEIFLRGSETLLSEVNAEIDRTERVLIFTRLIMQKPDELGLEKLSLAQAYALAQNLADLMDLAYAENLDFSRLQEIVPEEYAAHWQENLKLLAIITEYWPQILRERHAVDAMQRRNQLLEAECRFWQKNPPEQKIVVAGTTAAFPQLKELVKTVLELPDGEVYLYGLDYSLDDNSWLEIEENHPQFELKELLDYLQISRDSVAHSEDVFTGRERLVSEVMRPASSSAEWRQLAQHPLDKKAFSGLKLINCDDVRQEAKAIALIIRKTLETPEKTAALITADRSLARRVVAELKKWNITADDSAGQPLNLTPVGIYLRLILNVISEKFSQVSLLALLKHPFTACGMSRSVFNQKVRRLELNWRRSKRENDKEDAESADFCRMVLQKLEPLRKLYFLPDADIAELFRTHVETAERLADTDTKSGEKIIWKNEAGSAAAGLVSSFLEKCSVLEQVKPSDYGSFFEALLSGQNVRLRYGMHPRVKILGTIEARLSQFDTTIIGEVNEGVFPKQPEADLWMSRPMRHDFGFPLPERNIGVQAADFAHLLNAPEVYLVRALKVEKKPMNKSRWWLRLETVLAANFGGKSENYAFLYDTGYAFWAKNLERAGQVKPLTAPSPCPDVTKRPRELSATNIEYLLRNPYVIFAKYILRLYPLQEPDREFSALDYGNIVHGALQKFNQLYSEEYPADAEQRLLEIGRAEFEKANISAEVRAFWLPRFEKTVKWLTSLEKSYRENVKKVLPEITGEMTFSAPAGDFKITAKADRLDVNRDGTCTVIDYKTGMARSKKEVMFCKAPQLPAEGLIAANGGFGGKKMPVSSLRYWQLDGTETTVCDEECEQALENTERTLRSFISAYDMKEQPYYVNPNPSKGAGLGDYDHLSRFLEWSVQSSDNEEEKEDE